MTQQERIAQSGRGLDEMGNRYGRFVVVSTAPNRNGQRWWLCRCDCGTEKEIRGCYLRNGTSRSCGCLRRELAAERMRANQYTLTHGHSRDGFTPTYMTWVAMKNRCFYVNGVKYPRYGGRGITVCERWRDSFENFLADMGERPADKTLDRIDNDGNYEPGNCRWATSKEQRANQGSR